MLPSTAGTWYQYQIFRSDDGETSRDMREFLDLSFLVDMLFVESWRCFAASLAVETSCRSASFLARDAVHSAVCTLLQFCPFE